VNDDDTEGQLLEVMLKLEALINGDKHIELPV
jgi:hypothetical protein